MFILWHTMVTMMKNKETWNFEFSELKNLPERFENIAQQL